MAVLQMSRKLRASRVGFLLLILCMSVIVYVKEPFWARYVPSRATSHTGKGICDLPPRNESRQDSENQSKLTSPHQVLNKESGYILCHTLRCGRLGNRLFEYASALGIARTTGKELVITNGEQLQDLLKNPPPAPSTDRRQLLLGRCKRSKKATEPHSNGGAFHQNLAHVGPWKDYSVSGCLQSWKYFAHIMKEVRELVTFNDYIVNNASRLIQFLRHQHPQSSLVGIHVRRGDVASPVYSKIGWNLPTADYFRRAMTYFRSNLSGNVTFVVVSQEPDWWRRNMAPVDKNVVVMNTSSPAVDMQLLSMTDHLIQSIRSFSWWAAFKMANPASTVVYFKDWAGKSSKLDEWFSAKDYILPEWIGM